MVALITGYMAGIQMSMIWWCQALPGKLVQGGFYGRMGRRDRLRWCRAKPSKCMAARLMPRAIVASIIHREGAERLATYGGDEFYAGHSALTVNAYGKGKAYFVSTRWTRPHERSWLRSSRSWI